MGIKVKGISQAKKNLNDVINDVKGRKVIRALQSAMILIGARAAYYTPIDTSTLINSQLLLPIGKEKWALASTCTSAGVNLLFNSLLIPLLQRNGAAIGTIMAETSGLVVCLLLARKKFAIRDFFTRCWQYIVAALPILPIGWLLQQYISNGILFIIVTIAVSVAVYFTLLMLMKNETCRFLWGEGMAYLRRFRKK